MCCTRCPLCGGDTGLFEEHKERSGDRNLPRLSPQTFSFLLCSQDSCWQRGGTGMEVSAASPPSVTPKSRWKQCREMMAAYQWVLSFLFMVQKQIHSFLFFHPGPFFSLLIIFLLFTSLWSISVLYLVWLYLDWDTPNQGGRRCDWMRNLTVWKDMRDYYPIKLVKTAELPPNQNYVVGSHPHGIVCASTTCNFSTEGNGFSKHFPGIQTCQTGLSGLFCLPVYRDYIMSYGVRPVNRQSLDFVLSQPKRGQAVVIAIGGAHEALYANPGQHCLTLRKRKGFVRLALRHGASLVPVYSFGENDIFRLKAFADGSWQFRCQVIFKKLLGITPCIFWGRSLFLANSWGLLPFAVPITTVVGRPIPVPRRLHPTTDEVDHYHAVYMKALEQLFEEHKESCGVPASTHLTFL
ncbi:2-acylglycerol O-acyltransferase 3-like [Microcebus murinus]|uniref:2-acylglycerol O-acyltransferase 3-like n=1 Tax=Microcebus murinus TaxID=30608 RepID=UPI003F6C85EC